MKLILSSSSPARKSLLERLQIPFEACKPDVEETALPDESTDDMVQRLALLKAQSVAAKYPDALIIGSDCIGEVDGQLLQKPITRENALKQLQCVSNKKVRFATGLCLFNSSDSSYQLSVEEYFVYYRVLSDEIIENYLNNAPIEILHCAGSFQAEQFGIILVRKFEGNDFTSLIGLPLIRLVSMLNTNQITSR